MDELDQTQEIEEEGEVSPPLGRREFTSALESLQREFSESSDNIACYECKDCRYCAACMFCSDSKNCYRCNYCTGCEECSNCNHCDDCKGCHSCSQCIACEQCVGSAYLELSTNCSDCNYCFGCVGLQKVDFHILNVKYPRGVYFEFVKKLRREMSLRR